jgi:hypothetical protein
MIRTISQKMGVKENSRAVFVNAQKEVLEKTVKLIFDWNDIPVTLIGALLFQFIFYSLLKNIKKYNPSIS